MSTISKNKQELTEAITKNFDLLWEDIVDIPASFADKKELDGHAKGTTMSVHNLVSYLLGWGELVLKWHKRRNAGKPVDFPETGFTWGELGMLAQKFYADYADVEYSALLRKFRRNHTKMLQLVDHYSNAQLYGKPWEGKYTMGRYIQLNTSSPYKNARQRVRRWKKERGVGGDVVVFGVAANHKIAHAAADNERLIACLCKLCQAGADKLWKLNVHAV